MKIKQSKVLLTFVTALALSISVGCIWPFAGEETESTDNDFQSAEKQTQEQSKSESNEQSEKEATKQEEPKVVYRVNTGATESYETDGGETWKADKLVWKGDGEWGAEGGKAVSRGGIEIRNTSRDAIYQTERWGMPGYTFKVPEGTYHVRLHFSEAYHAVESEGTRIFTVNIEGKDVLKDFDVFKEAGWSRRTAVVRNVKNVPVKDGQLNINFDFQKLTPLINGIEVIKLPENWSPKKDKDMNGEDK